MAKKINVIDQLIANENLIDASFSDELENGMLNYGMKTIIDRALPDVRDGLKPVQRRILYSSFMGGYLFNKKYVKNAKIVGDTMGNLHPHGDGSIYSAETAMGQPWTFRYPLIDFQGNRGNIDGDGPAAMRYTEGRLAKMSSTMLDDINEKCVNFKSNYSETMEEPEYLPALLPNLLANGASGIAVGYTTDIPSHNLTELIDGIIATINNKNITIAQLMEYIKGPDLPCGACLVNNEMIKQLYETGKASLTFKSKYHFEDNEESGNKQIVFTEIPPDVKKPSLVEKIYNLCFDKKSIQRVVDVRDESEGDGVRIVVELHKTAIPEIVIRSLFDSTQLQKNSTYIMRCIVDQTPKILNLKQFIEYYIEHREEVVKRRSVNLLNKAKNKLIIQEGYHIVLNNIDKCIDIIRNSDDSKGATSKLIDFFKINDIQASKILDLPLRTLTKLNQKDIENLINELNASIDEYTKIINDEKERNRIIISELKKLKKEYGDERRTELIDDIQIDVEDEIVNESNNTPVAILLTNKGNIKHMSIEALETLEKNKVLKERTEIFTQCLKVKMADNFILILSDGQYIKVSFSDLLGNLDFIPKNTSVIKIIPFTNELQDKFVYIMSALGTIKKIKIENFKGKNLKLTPFFEIQEGDNIISVCMNDNSDDNIITLLTNDGLLHRFYDKGLKECTIKGKSMNCINLEDNKVIDFKISKENDDEDTKLIVYSIHGEEYSVKCSSLSEFKPKGRMSKGVKCIDYYKKSIGSVDKLLLLKEDSYVIDNKGNMISINLGDLEVSNKVSKPTMVEYNVKVTDFYL